MTDNNELSPREREILTLVARIFTALYFGYFIALWWISKNEKTKPVPERLTKK